MYADAYHRYPPAPTRPTLTDDELDVRFNLIEQLGIREIDIWVGTVPDSWLPYLRKFLATE